MLTMNSEGEGTGYRTHGILCSTIVHPLVRAKHRVDVQVLIPKIREVYE